MREVHPIRLAVLRSGRRQYQIARAAGFTETTFSRIISGRRDASPQERKRIAKALGRREDELFDDGTL